MSEYIEIETESGDDPQQMRFYTNVVLAPDAVEVYESVEAMEEGTPVAQILSYVDGIRHLRIEGNNLTVTRQPEAEWHVIVADVSAAIRDFFL